MRATYVPPESYEVSFYGEIHCDGGVLSTEEVSEFYVDGKKCRPFDRCAVGIIHRDPREGPAVIFRDGSVGYFEKGRLLSFR